MQSPQKTQRRAEQHGGQCDLQGVSQPLPNEGRNGGFLLVGVAKCTVKERAQIVPKLHEYRLVQMEGLAVVSYLHRGHILLGKAGEIGDGIPRQKPGQKEVQHHNDQEAHQCKDQILLILFHRCASCVKTVISW